MTKKVIILIALGAALSCIRQAHASGAYPARPPQPPAGAANDQYNLGKQIFAGKAKLNPVPGANVADQSARLKELQDKLPKSAQKDAKLSGLAGQLTAEQMKALEHFLEVRYKIK